MNMKKTCLLILFILLMAAVACAVGEEPRREAPEITASCEFSLNGKKSWKNVMDHSAKSYWESASVKNSALIITAKEPVYGLYLCFRTMPAYEIEVDRGAGWEKAADGNPEYLHAFYTFDGVNKIRIIATGDKKVIMGFNEISVFGEGEIPAWVQRWEPVPEKTDLMFVIANPDDEVLYMGGAIPVYAVEKRRATAVVCLAYDNPSRRSELLNSLWSMGYRYYPMICSVKSLSSKTREEALSFTCDAIRRCRPEVMVTLDENGEGNNPQRKMASSVCDSAFDRAAIENGANGTWQVRKLYKHLYGSTPTVLDWEQPLECQRGLTGISTARYAYLYYKTQDATDKSVLGTGTKYPNNQFGLARTTVGEDKQKNDFLENIPSDQLTEMPALKDLTVDKTADILPELNEAGYIDEGEFIYSDDLTGIYVYISPTLKIIINRRFDGSLPLTWFETEIWCDIQAGEMIQNVEIDPERRHKARGDAAETALMHHVVFAANGDYYTYRMGSKNGHPVGIEIRNGEIYFDTQYSEKTDFFPNLDTLAFYPDGRVEVHHSYELTAQEYLDRGAYNVFSFGPYLIKEGQLSEWVMDYTKTNAKNPRHVFGMITPGHYMDIMFEGRLGSRSEGVTMPQAALLAQAAGLMEACNLDGGQTAVVVFMGKQLNKIGKYDGKTNARPTCEVFGAGISDQVGTFEVR